MMESPQAGWQAEPAPRARPGGVTAAAVILFVLCAFNFLGAALLPSVDDSGLFIALAVFSAVIAVAQLVAGVWVLRLDDRGRLVGLIVSGIGLALGVVSLVQGFGGAVLGIALNGVVIAMLRQHRDAFAAR